MRNGSQIGYFVKKWIPKHTAKKHSGFSLLRPYELFYAVKYTYSIVYFSNLR